MANNDKHIENNKESRQVNISGRSECCVKWLHCHNDKNIEY